MSPPDVCRDFDFQIGRWTVKHRRLRERLAGCTDWDAFDGACEMRTVLGGNGNIEDNVLYFPSGSIRAIAIRSWDPAAKTWAIWWLASNDPHRMDVPVVGRFKDGDGTFLAEDTLDGRPILTRFLWLNTRTETPCWEQAMSADGGASWETNWTMDFTRA